MASLVLPPNVKATCLSWVPNIDSVPTYFASERTLMVGSGSDYLTVLDVDTGKVLVNVPSEGRVVTGVAQDKASELLFFGTEKGLVKSVKAYSYLPHSRFQADSKINPDLGIFNDAVIFSTVAGTLYGLDIKDLKQRFKLESKDVSERLRLTTQSGWRAVMFKGQNAGRIVVPAPEGELLFVDPATGDIKDKLSLGVASPKQFPDIVAPLVWLKDTLWVASYDLGLFAVDAQSAQIKRRFDHFKILELAADGQTLYAATSESLIALDTDARVIWRNDFSTLKSRVGRLGYPFNNFKGSSERIFRGSISELIIWDKKIALASMSGSLGIFDAGTGDLLQVLGNNVGFSSNITKVDGGIFAMSRMGNLLRFTF